VAFQKNFILFSSLCLATPLTLAQQMCLPGELSPETLPNKLNVPTENQRLQVTTGRIDLSNENRIELSDQVNFQYGNRSISADRAIFYPETQDAEVHGTVTYKDPEITVYGNDAEVNAQTDVISFSGGGFNLPNRTARGSANTITINNNNTISLDTVNYWRASWTLILMKDTALHVVCDCASRASQFLLHPT
jgi:lipopolysaccharide assembly outer membrane protein LptD (OstA)